MMPLMLWLKWISLGFLTLAIVALIVLVIGSLVSLDWRRGHSRSTAALPSFATPNAQPDGLTVITVGDLEFRARVRNLAGEGDAVIMLHGFPQSSAAWEPLMDAAAARGLRVVAFDQRGYSPGARPPGRDAYTLDRLIADALGIADAVGFDRFHLVGHDWGAAVGWGVVMSEPDRVLSWSALSIAHSYAFGEAVRTDPDQRRRSRYFLLFRTPLLPELLLSFNRNQVFRNVMYRWMPERHTAEYLDIFSEPGALTGALNWYRAVGHGGTGALPGDVNLPVLFIWGNRDPAAGRRSVELQDQYMQGPFQKIEVDGGHWLLERHTDVVVDAVLAHIDRYGTTD